MLPIVIPARNHMKRDKKIKCQEDMKDLGAETVDCLLLTKPYVNKVLWKKKNILILEYFFVW